MITKFKINGRYYQKYEYQDGVMKIDFNDKMSLSEIVYFVDWADKGDARDIEVYEKQNLELDKKIAKNCKVNIVEGINNYCYIKLKYDYLTEDLLSLI
jgi:hypothetical protein